MDEIFQKVLGDTLKAWGCLVWRGSGETAWKEVVVMQGLASSPV